MIRIDKQKTLTYMKKSLKSYQKTLKKQPIFKKLAACEDIYVTAIPQDSWFTISVKKDILSAEPNIYENTNSENTFFIALYII